jgi:hypothetical protein
MTACTCDGHPPLCESCWQLRRAVVNERLAALLDDMAVVRLWAAFTQPARTEPEPPP